MARHKLAKSTALGSLGVLIAFFVGFISIENKDFFHEIYI
jgi:multisubunit Na+/H+ antiporter MnhG subunit